MKQLHLRIKGKVQGVFYRDNTRKKAKELGLRGYVKNLEDGSVEVIVLGEEDKINQLIKFCKSSPGSSEVKEITIEEQPLSPFDDFKVRY